MASERVNIMPGNIEWAIHRAGYQAAEYYEKNPDVMKWISGEKNPTFHQLETFANKVKVPFGYLFIEQLPVERLPFTMFRGGSAEPDYFDLDVYDTVINIQRRQEWLEDYLVENDIETFNAKKSISGMTVDDAVSQIRDLVGLAPDWAFAFNSQDAAVNHFTECLEERGIFVAFNGVVGNNTHRQLSVDKCRGFAMVSSTAPYIFINSSDSKNAQLFTLLHELAHILSGSSAGHRGFDFSVNNSEEVFCDKVAAEFLVPASLLTPMWNSDIRKLSRDFKVSEIVIARRAHDLGLMSDIEYRSFASSFYKRPRISKKGSGGDFYRSCAKRVGRTFAVHVYNAVRTRQLSYTDAYLLTNVRYCTLNEALREMGVKI